MVNIRCVVLGQKYTAADWQPFSVYLTGGTSLRGAQRRGNLPPQKIQPTLQHHHNTPQPHARAAQPQSQKSSDAYEPAPPNQAQSHSTSSATYPQKNCAGPYSCEGAARLVLNFYRRIALKHDCGISSPALSFSQAVHQKTVILRKSYLPACLNNHSPILEGTL